MWYGTEPQLSHIYTFGELGTIPVYAPKKKLEPRADPARYMYPTSLSHIVVFNLKSYQYQQIRAADFHPYHTKTDPTATTTAAFKARADCTQKPRTFIDINTPPPSSLKQARQYPDSEEWKTAHNAEIENIGNHQSIKWLHPNFIPPAEAIVPLMMLYRYKRSIGGSITQRKARCNLRDDLMQPGVHFDPKHTTTYTADRTTQRMLLALHANHQLPLEHFDITLAYLHETYTHDKPVYVPQMLRFDGSYKHPGRYGLLRGNLYGSPLAAYYYNHGLRTFLRQLNFKLSDHDACLYTKVTPQGFIVISTTIDDFLVLTTNTNLINELYKELLTKYRIKRLGRPTRFLNWNIQYNTDGSIHLSQPNAIAAVLLQTNMSNCNPALTQYSNRTSLNQISRTAPLSTSDTMKCRQILGEIRYITDSTRPDINYATNRLVQHMAAPQKHHWQALKTLLRYLKGTSTHGLLYKPTTKEPNPQLSATRTSPTPRTANP